MTTAQKEPRRQLAAFRLRALCRARRAPIPDAQPTSFSQAASRCARLSIVALDPQPSGGRRRNRIRHPGRKCRSRSLQQASSLSLATLNVQGWNWSRLDPWNTDKAADLVSLARQHGWDVLALSDLHTSAGEVEIWENNSRTARRVQRDVSNAIVALEEFILVAGQRSGFLLSPAAAEAWRDSGCAKELSDDGRLLRLHINILDQRYDFVSGYAPTGDTQGRRNFLESASAFLSARPHALQLWLGDWNGHVGRLSSAPQFRDALVFLLRRPPPVVSSCSGLMRALRLFRWPTATLALGIGVLGGPCVISPAALQVGIGMSVTSSCVAPWSVLGVIVGVRLLASVITLPSRVVSLWVVVSRRGWSFGACERRPARTAESLCVRMRCGAPLQRRWP